MDLLDLPPELVRRVLVALICHVGLPAAVKARLVCKRFDKDIVSLLWITRVLERSHPPKFHERIEYHHPPIYHHAKQLYVEYLFQRTQADRARRYHLTTAINDALDHIEETNPSTLPERSIAVKKALQVVLDSTGCWYPLDYDNLGRLERSCRPYSISEHAAMLSIHLKLYSVFERLVENGVQECKTYFGSLLDFVPGSGDTALAKIYLKAKLTAQTMGSKEVHLPQFSELSLSSNGQPTRRGISANGYALAFANALHAGRSVESLNLFLDAAIEDGQVPRFWSRIIDYENVRQSVSDIALLVACSYGYYELAKAALDRGADVGACYNGRASAWSLEDTTGQHRMGPPMVEAARCCSPNHIRIMKLLSEYGAQM